MFERVIRTEVQEILDYFLQDPKNCLYSYIDLKKYGLDNPNLELYVDRKGQDISCVLTKYYGGVNVFSHKNVLDSEMTAKKLGELTPTMINAPAETIQLLKPWLEKQNDISWEYEQGYVTELKSCLAYEEDDLREKDPTAAVQTGSTREKDLFPEVEEAAESDIPEIARLICTDEGLGGTYEPENFAKQLLERRQDNFGRYFCIRQNGRIVCHAGTYAEVEELAVISGVITAEDCRGQNLAYKVVSKLGKQLLDEGKLPCLFYYTKSAARLYEKVGFASGTPWAKLIRKQG